MCFCKKKKARGARTGVCLAEFFSMYAYLKAKRGGGGGDDVITATLLQSHAIKYNSPAINTSFVRLTMSLSVLQRERNW